MNQISFDARTVRLNQAARREEREDLLDKVSAEAGCYFVSRVLEQCSC